MTGWTVPLANDLIYTGRNILIAGQAGSGKSVFMNNLINSILYMDPCQHKMVLIDPKQVEFARYENCYHTLGVAFEPESIEPLLDGLINTMLERNRDMRTRKIKQWDGSIIHLLVDEMADLMLTSGRAKDQLQRICQMGRAAGIQVICATQCPLASVIPTRIKVNFHIIVGLHTLNAQHSRNILDVPGCEKLPMTGECLIARPGRDIERVKVSMISEEWLDKIVEARTPKNTTST